MDQTRTSSTDSIQTLNRMHIDNKTHNSERIIVKQQVHYAALGPTAESKSRTMAV